MSIFRLIRGEMQKILLRPLMYIISIVLLASLIATIFLFPAHNRQDMGYQIAGTTKAEVYTNYLNDSTINKTIADNQLTEAQNLVIYYSSLNQEPATTTTAKIKTLITTANGELAVYQNNLQSSTENSANFTELEASRQEILDTIVTLKNLLIDATQSDKLKLLITQNDLDKLASLLTTVLSYLNDPIDTNSFADHRLLADKLLYASDSTDIEGINYFDKMQTMANQNMTDVIVSKSKIEQLQTLHTTASQYLLALDEKIAADLNDSNVATQDFKSTVLCYYYTSLQYKNLVQDCVIYLPVSSYQDGKINSFVGYKDINSYQMQTNITRNTYLLQNNLTDNTCAFVFSPSTSFSNTTSAFDLVYFGIEICGIVIMLVCVILIASMIAEENNKGTLRILALRPYSKGQILSSKILATLIFGFILLLFSAIILFIAGWIMFGIDITNILVIFGGTTAFGISPIALIFIYLALFMLKITFYCLLSAMVATLSRSTILTLIIPTLLFIANAVFGFVFNLSYWYAYVPFASVDLFKFFGGSAITQSPISMLFSTPLYHNSNFIYSICVVAGLMIVMSIISHIAFKKKEIK